MKHASEKWLILGTNDENFADSMDRSHFNQKPKSKSWWAGEQFFSFNRQENTEIMIFIYNKLYESSSNRTVLQNTIYILQE